MGRRLSRGALSLTLDSIGASLADAGIAPRDVDGLMTYPGGSAAMGPAFGGPSLSEVYDALRIEPKVLMGNFEGPAQLGPILNAALAVSAGLARHVVVYRTVTEGTARAARTSTTGAALPEMTAMGGGPAPIGYALLARRHFHDYGTTRQQLAHVALNARRRAALNPKAVMRHPLSLDQYLDSRMVADPLCLYDCDVHCDGSTSLVISHRDFGPDARNPVVHLEAMGTAPPARADFVQHEELWPGGRAADMLWNRTDLRASDVDVAGIYDGFSILTLLWLEALGFCARGEGGPFLEGGGAVPFNTDGGQLSGGRLHGFGFVHEVCLQLRGQAAGRQVADARTALVSVGALPYVGCMLLRAES